MKIQIFIIIILLFVTSVSAQNNNCCDKVEEQAVRIKDAETKIQSLEKDKKNLEEQLNQKNDNNSNRNDYLRDSVYWDGQQNILTILADFYRKPLDYLVNTLSIEEISRDKDLFDKLKFDDANILKKANGIYLYKQAEALLLNKFDVEKVNQAQQLLSKLTQNEPVFSKLSDLLNKFQDREEGLSETLSKIVKTDELQAKGNEVIKDEKWKEIWININQYLFSYGVNLEDYPYLRKIIFELISIKQDDIDKDIKGLIDKL